MTWISAWWNQVSATVAYGLQITVVGMLLVFFTLGLVIVSLILLGRLRPSQAQEEPDKEPATTSPPTFRTATGETVSADEELAQVAAIAAAIVAARLNSRQRTSTRRQAQVSGSKWKHYGRAHQVGL